MPSVEVRKTANPFLVYINDILNSMPKSVEASLFADDLAIWSSHQNIDVARSILQKGLDKLVKWTDTWKMQVNCTKCEVTFFTNAPNEAKYSPTMRFAGQVLPINSSPRFLGITFDRTLSFKEHTKKLKTKLQKRNSILSTLTSILIHSILHRLL